MAILYGRAGRFCASVTSPKRPGLRPGQELLEKTLSPALVIHLDVVRRNIASIIRLCEGDASRWRPHVKTTKCAAGRERYGVQGPHLNLLHAWASSSVYSTYIQSIWNILSVFPTS
jgi:hypothetical protein